MHDPTRGTAAPHKTGMVEPLPLVIDEADIDPTTRAAVLAAQRGPGSLATTRSGDQPTDSPERVLLDAMPAVIARRIEGILPPGFKIAELEFCFAVEGKLWGSGIKGEVKATFRPE